MASERKQTTTLWSVIEKMQKRLEAEGLDRDVVDAAVARGLEALLDIAPPVRAAPEAAQPGAQERAEKGPAPRMPLWVRSRAPAKA
jgi:hypothetical protein